MDQFLAAEVDQFHAAESTAKLKQAAADGDPVHFDATATGHMEGRLPVFDVVLEIGDEAFNGSLTAEYDGTGALTFSVGADIKFLVAGRQAELNAAVGYDVVNGSWNIQAGASIDVSDRWSVATSYRLDQSGKEETTVTIICHF